VKWGTYGKELCTIRVQVTDDLKGLSVRFIHCIREHHYEHENIIGDLRCGGAVCTNRSTTEMRNRRNSGSPRTIPAQAPMSGIGLWGITHALISGTQVM